MNILVDFCHPAHVHFFRHASAVWREAGHRVVMVHRDRDIIEKLLAAHGMKSTRLGLYRTSAAGFALEMAGRDLAIAGIARREKIDLMMGIGGVFIAHAGAVTNSACWAFTDTERAGMIHPLTYPFCNAYVTPRCFGRDMGKKQVRYPGFHELAYLHPNRFRPDAAVLDELGVSRGERYAVLRFISWGASHDIGTRGLSREAKGAIVKEVERHARVFISFEGASDEGLERYRIPIRPERIHHALAFSSLYAGEGATMASEAAVLGVPAVYINDLTAGTTGEQARLGLLFERPPSKHSTDDIVRTVREALEAPAARWRDRKRTLLAENVDVTKMLVKMVEGFPDSIGDMRTDPKYWEGMH